MGLSDWLDQAELLLRSGSAEPSTPPRFSLDAPVLHLSDSDVLTARHCMEHAFLSGRTGSGKTSGPYRMLAESMLASGWGLLFLTTKPDDAKTIHQWAVDAGRSDDVILFSEAGEHRFNFLAEACKAERGGGQTESILHYFLQIFEIADRQKDKGSSEPFWPKAKAQLVRSAIDLAHLATGTVTLLDIYRIVSSIPYSPEEASSEEWLSSSYCARLLAQAIKAELPESRRLDLDITYNYFINDLAAMSPRTRSGITAHVTSLIDAMLRGTVRDLFCTDTTVTPAATFDGAVIIVDMPVKQFFEVGLIAAGIWKLAFQRAVERRSVDDNTRPVGLIVDECHFFASSYDPRFLATARSSRASVVYAVQNLPMLYEAVGENETHALLGNLVTHFYLSNACTKTNEWCANTIAKMWQFRASVNNGHSAPESDRNRSRSHSAGGNEHLEFELPPAVFTQLSPGGPPDFEVEAIAFRPGRPWNATARNWMRVTFPQVVEP